MTTKDALELAIIALQTELPTEKNTEAISLLRKLQRRDIVSKWTKETIIAALDNWKELNKKPPTTTNLIEPGMPGANIIQQHFGMRASAFLHKRYPSDNNTHVLKNKYGFLSEGDWICCFQKQFLKHCNEDGFNSKTYNMFKDKDTPLWMTIARHCGTTKWTKLMELAKVEYPWYSKRNVSATLHVSYVKSPWLERFESAVAKREELDRQLIKSINNK